MHALLVFVHLVGTPPDPTRAPAFRLPLLPLADTARVQLMPYVPPRLERRRPLPGPPRTEARRAPDVAVPPPPDRVTPPPPDRPVPPEPAAPSTARGVFGGLRPSLGQGTLWVRPMPLPPTELAMRLRQKSHYELVDSAVQAIVQQYLDSLANDPTLRPAAPPSWVAKVGGKDFGIDGRNIIVAGLRIPAAILGFLPIALPVRYDPNRTERGLRDMREDLMAAAQRAANYEDFKRSIKEIRERKQAERDFERNQRSVPPFATDSLQAGQ